MNRVEDYNPCYLDSYNSRFFNLEKYRKRTPKYT